MNEDYHACNNKECSEYEKPVVFKDALGKIDSNPGMNCPKCDGTLKLRAFRDLNDNLGFSSDSIG